MKINETAGALLMVGVAVAFTLYLGQTLPLPMEGVNYADAAKDTLGLRILKLALFDLHAVGIFYFYGGNSWKTIELMKKYPFSTSVILGAIVLGSAIVLM